MTAWNGFKPDEDWSIALAVGPLVSHNTLWCFYKDYGYATLRFFSGWGMVFTWTSDTGGDTDNSLTLGYRGPVSHVAFEMVIAYNSEHYTHDGGGSTPDISDVDFFIRNDGGSMVKLEKSTSGDFPTGMMFPYYYLDKMDESHDVTWASSDSMTAVFGGYFHGLDAISPTNDNVMSGLKLWNKAVVLGDLTG